MTKVHISCPATILDEDQQECECDMLLEVELFYDSDYGADADGRRGVPAYFLEDITQENCKCDLSSAYMQLKIQSIAVEQATHG